MITNYFYSDLIKEVLETDDHIQSLAQELYQQKSLLIMGRGFNYATCLEGALVSSDHSSVTTWITIQMHKLVFFHD